MFLTNITFNNDIVFDSDRESHSKYFKIKKRKKTYTNYRKPIYENDKPWSKLGYEKEKVIEKTFVIFEKGLSIDFNDNITIIVGDNGCGKTSLLNMLKLKNAETYYNNDLRKLTFDKQPNNLFIGKELHKNALITDLKSSKLTLNIGEVDLLFRMQTASNGENMLDFFNAISTLNNSLIVLDEPETSLSIKSQKNISNLIKNLSNNNQIIIVTHSPIIMSLSDNVYDLESKQYIDTNTYINNQLK